MDSDGVLGYACCLVAAIFFGSNYVPVKKLTNLGDGVFFSVCMTLGVFTV
jgi:drug/metabolite transporter (DMT)-like permease